MRRTIPPSKPKVVASVVVLLCGYRLWQLELPLRAEGAWLGVGDSFNGPRGYAADRSGGEAGRGGTEDLQEVLGGFLGHGAALAPVDHLQVA
jgi:hypothetical protein